MVQGTVVLGQSTSGLNIQEYDKTAKKSGYEAIQKIQQGNSNDGKDRKNPWGNVFKNQDNFKSMHIC